jgi:hypothetical protein
MNLSHAEMACTLRASRENGSAADSVWYAGTKRLGPSKEIETISLMQRSAELEPRSLHRARYIKTCTRLRAQVSRKKVCGRLAKNRYELK